MTTVPFDRLIAGTAALGKLNSERAIRHMLDRIHAAGIRSFDTAPLYAAGCMERILGNHFKNTTDITFHTKFGLTPPIDSSSLAHLYLPSKLIQAGARALGRRTTQIDESKLISYAKDRILRSIEQLGRPIDLWLAHEVPLSLLNHHGFNDLLESFIKSGLVRKFGVGGYRQQYALPEHTPIWQLIDVLQVESLPGSPPPHPSQWNGEVFLHGIFSAYTKTKQRPSAIQAIAEALTQQKASKVILGFSCQSTLESTVDDIINP